MIIDQALLLAQKAVVVLVVVNDDNDNKDIDAPLLIQSG